MKKSYNKLKFKSLDDLRNYLQKSYPSLSVAFYLHNFPNSSIKTSNIEDISYHVFEVDGDELIWKTYRKSDTPVTNDWDVDQINSVNKQVRFTPDKKDIPDHHINGKPEDNIMKRNHMTFEVIEDQNGNFLLNRKADGLIRTFINIEEPPARLSSSLLHLKEKLSIS